MFLLPFGIFITITWANLLWGLSRLENIFEIIAFLFLLHLQRKVWLQVKFPNFWNSKLLPKSSGFQRPRAWLNPHSPGSVSPSPTFPPIPPSRNLQEKWFLHGHGKNATGGLIPTRQSICYTWSVSCLRLPRQARSRAGRLVFSHAFNKRPILLSLLIQVSSSVALSLGRGHFLALWRGCYVLKAYINGSVGLLS